MKKIKSKSGKEIVFREIDAGDAEKLLQYINKLVEEDVPILLNEKQTLDSEQQYVERALMRIKEGKKVQFLALDGDRIVGNAQVEKEQWKASHVGIFGISLADGYRSEGIGTKLAEYVIEQARARLQVEKIKLDVFANNPCGLGLYKKLGFVETGKIPGGVKHRGEDVDRIIMIKEL